METFKEHDILICMPGFKAKQIMEIPQLQVA